MNDITIHQISLSCNPLPPNGYGGIETVISNLAIGLSEHGLKVICYAPAPFNLKGVEHYQTLKSVTKGFKEGVNIVNSLEHLEATFEGLKKNYKTGDIIHFHHAEQVQYLKEKLEEYFKEKVYFIETAHWRNIGLNNNIAYPSKALKSELKKDGSIIPHSIDTDVFKLLDLVREAKTLFYAGRISKDKGVHLISQLADDCGYNLKIAGPIIEHDYANTFLDSCDYLGELNPTQLSEEYNKAFAFIYMTQYNEPFGLAVAEALACGCPVITNGNGGTGEVPSQKSGIICETYEDFKKALEKIGTLKAIDCRERALEYSNSKMAQSYIKFYQEILNNDC